MCESKARCGIAPSLTRNRTPELARKTRVFPQAHFVNFCNNFAIILKFLAQNAVIHSKKRTKLKESNRTMGLSSTQVRLLQLTNRKNDIGLELSKLSNSKVALTRDMQKLSRDYNNKINQKTLKWSNNGGASYVDLSYQNLLLYRQL